MGRVEIVPKLQLEHIQKTFYDSHHVSFKVIQDISFNVYPSEFLVILGPGLCGKTVLLNMIAGLESLSGGKILLDGKELTDDNKGISMVFQKTGLLAWKTVMENVEIGLKYRGVPKEERRAKARKFIELVGLKGFETAFPRQLSGGMKQRVGIARAYTADPELLLMDEPFGALDAQTRYAMEEELRRTWEMEKKTVVFVTNNIEEAVYLGDRIVLLGSCPTTIREIYTVNLPRPRNQLSEEFMMLRQKISDNMELII